MRQYSLRNAMTAGKNEIVSRQFKPLDGSWKQRQIVAIGSFRRWQLTNKRSFYLHVPDGRRNFFGCVHQGVKIGRRKKLAEHLQAFFTAPHSRQPIMHQGHTHAGISIANTREGELSHADQMSLLWFSHQPAGPENFRCSQALLKKKATANLPVAEPANT